MRLVQELLAIMGIAVGVALLFASQIASTSLDGSVRQVTSGIVGDMRFQLAARGPSGFDERLLGEVQRIPGVRAAAPVLEQHMTVLSASGSRSVELIGTDPHFAHLGGPLLRHFTAAQLAGQQAFALPEPIARSIGLLSLQTVNIEIGARVIQGFLGAELLESDIGALVNSPVAIAPLAYAQRLAGMPGRVTRIFVQPFAGHDREVQTELTRLAAGRLNVRPAAFDASLFDQAAGPTNQSALLFSAISALVGFLFAFNAILLTAPQRRRLVEDLRLDGYGRWAIVETLVFDALILGTVASLAGLALGDLLSLAVFHSKPGYLSFAFPVGTQRIITLRTAAIAVGGGLSAALVGVLAPLRGDVLSPLSLAPVMKPAGRARTSGFPLAGLVCLAVTTGILLAAPRAAIVGIVSLLAALLLLLPSLIREGVLVADRLQRSIRGASPYLAIIELSARANRSRSAAIAATGAIAMLGSVAIQGAHANLQRGLDRSSQDLARIADLWVTTAGPQNVLATTPFNPTATGKLSHLPGVAAVRVYRAGFLDYGNRRVWVLGPPRTATAPIPPSQLLGDDLGGVTARFRQGGWVVLSQALAAEHHVGVGQSITLPTPRPRTFRVAALSTNLGWPPGVVILNGDDYASAWASEQASAYNVMLRPGVSPGEGQREIERALGAGSGLVVQSAADREGLQRRTSRQGLGRLTQIATLVLIAAILATATAMGAMIWQRRPRLGDLKVDGFSRGVLWRALLLESALLLGIGCSVGALFGLYGALLLSHALATVTGFPVVFSLGVSTAFVSFALVTVVAVATVAVPGYLAARVRPAVIAGD
jgi:putative ABC transport system permease protein